MKPSIFISILVPEKKKKKKKKFRPGRKLPQHNTHFSLVVQLSLTSTTGYGLANSLLDQVKICNMASPAYASIDKPKNATSYAIQARDLVLHTVLDAIYFAISLYSFAALIYHRSQIQWFKFNASQDQSPQKINRDISSLPKMPGHLAAVLKFDESAKNGTLEALVQQVGQLACWCAGAGIPALTIYERQGVLKALDLQLFQQRITKKLDLYFGDAPTPTLCMKIPQSTPSISNADLVITLIAEEDGRKSLVDLARNLGDMALQNKISPNEITISSIDDELKRKVVGEPDLIIIFAPHIDFQGFPPWQMRLSEIFHFPDNSEVSYPVFRMGLEKYAGCKINVGR